MYIRKAEETDLARILEVFEIAIRKTCVHDYSPYQIEVWASSKDRKERWLKAIQEEFFLVAFIKDELIGFASLEYQAYVDLLYVHPDFQKMGVASRLFD